MFIHPLSLCENAAERLIRGLFFRHQFQHFGCQERVIALTLFSRFDIRKPAAADLHPKQGFQAVSGKVVDHLVHPELRLFHLHHLLRKIGIHRLRADTRQKAPEVLRESV